ncbi:protealysin inhibitor emfourin [Microbacterium ureisolvens]|uniref:protealysin inhibitor emfourin n=1 Tax=Microbacterium ureisolvens TaxID=2781186 RepID=UPI00362BB313
MRAHDPSDDAPEAGADIVLIVRVVRTGGFAGLKREWTAEPPPEDVPHWRELIDGCPWNDAAADDPPEGADRFQWRITVTLTQEPPREAEMTDDRLEGPWRDLVDEVRAFEQPVAAASEAPKGGRERR